MGFAYALPILQIIRSTYLVNMQNVYTELVISFDIITKAVNKTIGFCEEFIKSLKSLGIFPMSNWKLWPRIFVTVLIAIPTEN